MKDYTLCSVCKHVLQHVPIQKHEEYIIIEHFCPSCQQSEIEYESLAALQ